MKSRKWKRLRWRVLVRDRFTCQCGCGHVERDTAQLVADQLGGVMLDGAAAAWQVNRSRTRAPPAPGASTPGGSSTRAMVRQHRCGPCGSCGGQPAKEVSRGSAFRATGIQLGSGKRGRDRSVTAMTPSNSLRCGGCELLELGKRGLGRGFDQAFGEQRAGVAELAACRATARPSSGRRPWPWRASAPSALRHVAQRVVGGASQQTVREAARTAIARASNLRGLARAAKTHRRRASTPALHQLGSLSSCLVAIRVSTRALCAADPRAGGRSGGASL